MQPRRTHPFTIIFWFFTTLTFAGAMAMMIWYAPVEKTMGEVQKIFYFHLPVAINAFLCCFVVFVASVGYLWQRKYFWDDLAAAAGKTAAIYCTVVLLTGMIWGRSAWGNWWTWSPRLTLALVLWLLYLVYVMIRPAIESPRRRAIISAIYGVIAFLDVPLVYMSTKLMPDIHPKSIELASEMKTTLLVWFLPVTLLAFGLIWSQFRLNQRERTLNESNYD